MDRLGTHLARWLTDSTTARQAVISVLVVIMAAVIRVFVVRAIRASGGTTDQHRLRWLAHTRTAIVTLTVTGLILVWAEELRTFAISVAAIAAALVLATKELILSLTGGILRTSARSFSIGDRIELGKTRGDVVDIGFLTTTVLEVGPGHQWTGRTIVLPNSQLLATEVTNETRKQAFVLHVVRVPLPSGADWRRAEELLVEAARSTCEPYLDEARDHLAAAAEQEGIEPPFAEPRVMLHIDRADGLDLLLRLPARARDKGKIEQAVIRRFLEGLDASSPST